MSIEDQSQKPINIGYTLGDLAGIGPEIFFKFRDKNVGNKNFNIVLIDDEKEIDSLLSKVIAGSPSAFCGDHSYTTLLRAHIKLLSGEIDYLVTGPVAKESLNLAGIESGGQTELLAQINGLESSDVEMMFALDDLKVVLATRHCALKDVASKYCKNLEKVIKNCIQALETNFDIKNPKIDLLGLNPHAGENGLFGLEEKTFVSKLMSSMPLYDLNGPFPADAHMAKLAQRYLSVEKQEQDLVIAAYHDQVLPLIKGIGGYKALNITLGLPYLRISVDHGTAFDIAGQGRASEAALEACTSFCLKHWLGLRQGKIEN